MIPILIRSKDRVDYLYTTLKSLTGTILNDAYIVIVDDYSESDEMNKFLFSNDTIKLKNIGWKHQIKSDIKENSTTFFNPHNLSDEEMWDKFIGNKLPYETKITGIKDKFTVIQPNKNMGDLCGLYWAIMAGFELFRNAEKIIILEDDLIFNKNWLNITNYIYENEKRSKLGLISVYNRDNDNLYNEKMYKTTNNIGGVMYLIPRTVYDFLKRTNSLVLNINKEDNIGGDVHLQNKLLENEYLIYNSNESYIQHIGIRSLVRPGRFLRMSRNFVQPFAWNKDF